MIVLIMFILPILYFLAVFICRELPYTSLKWLQFTFEACSMLDSNS